MTDEALSNSTASTHVAQFSGEQVALIKRTVAHDATDDELKLFINYCQRTGLDPLSKQIYFSKFKNKSGFSTVTFITAIDGYRSVADRTGKYAGSDDAVFDDETKPSKATVTVYKMVGGQRCPFTATARWSEYYPGQSSKSFMWDKMPCNQLAKCAEALALRKAFPQQLGGVYTDTEMDQAHSDPIKAPSPSMESLPPMDTLGDKVLDDYVIDLGPKNKLTGKHLYQASAQDLKQNIDWWSTKGPLTGKPYLFVKYAQTYLDQQSTKPLVKEDFPPFTDLDEPQF